ncbi:MAG: hypothetical protein EBZ75_14685 [Oxalobacteraceae bacterium]|nr:hypothetical protein [Oxalobacteraceae bacterium]
MSYGNTTYYQSNTGVVGYSSGVVSETAYDRSILLVAFDVKSMIESHIGNLIGEQHGFIRFHARVAMGIFVAG